MQQLFDQLGDSLFSQLLEDESLAISLEAENSLFTRVNGARIRQTGQVSDGSLLLNLMANNRQASATLTLSGDADIDRVEAQNELVRLRDELSQLPLDPFVVIPVGGQISHKVQRGDLLETEQSVEQIIAPMQGSDLSGILASGTIYRGNANSSGSKHWFESDSFSLDYSIINEQEKMVKSTYAAAKWSQSDYQNNLSSSLHKLQLLDQDSIKLEPGNYRTYIASAGVADILHMFSWNGLSELSMQTGESAFLKMRDENLQLSALFSLAEDFSNGLVPRFNTQGEVCAERLELISQGCLKTCQISSRTAKEYALESNFADEYEDLRSPVMASGHLAESDVLQALGTGVYLSNLHYLNWSDLAGGRITGMTRYACFWVEEGKIKAPIENMRFDDSFYHFFGDNLEAVGKENYINPDVGTYEGREIGMTQCPGILLSSFSLTL